MFSFRIPLDLTGLGSPPSVEPTQIVGRLDEGHRSGIPHHDVHPPRNGQTERVAAGNRQTRTIANGNRLPAKDDDQTTAAIEPEDDVEVDETNSLTAQLAAFVSDPAQRGHSICVEGICVCVCAYLYAVCPSHSRVICLLVVANQVGYCASYLVHLFARTPIGLTR